MTTALIIGASLAGLRAVETLRHEGFDGRVVVVGAEDHMPYDRPPLSKKFLAGEWDADRIALRRPEVLEPLNVEWILGRAATGLDVERRVVSLDSGETLDYDGLVIATGGVTRSLPNQSSLAGVYSLRTLDDATDLREHIGEGTRVVVIGAGFIGLEVAATAIHRGSHVTVLEGLPAPLIRALGVEMGDAIGAIHVRNGVAVRCGVSVKGIVGNERVTGVELSDGEIVPADVVLVGIGVSPATSWLEGSGLNVADGIVCDANLNTGTPGVFAAGDVARWPNNFFTDIEPTMRVEHWTNAAEQGAHAARNLVAWFNEAEPLAYEAVPFFWSDQFDMRIQFLGRTHADARVDVVAGSTAEGKWCAMYSMNDRMIGVLGVSMPKMVMPSRTMLSTRTSRAAALEFFSSLTGG